MIKIDTSGDYVQLIYVDPVGESVQQELKSDTDAFEVSYDSEGKLYLQFGLMKFENPDPTDFTINDVAVTDAADFITKLNALFTGGGGGGATIYTGDGDLTGDREVGLEGHSLRFEGTSDYLLSLSDLVSALISSDTFGAFSSLYVRGDSQDPTVKFSLTSNNGAGTVTSIEGNAVDGSLRYSADTHIFNGAVGITDLGGNGAGFAAVGNDGVMSWAAGDPAGTIYAADGALSNDRTVDLNGHDLEIAGLSGQTMFEIDQTAKYSLLQATPNGDITAKVELSADAPTNVYFSLNAVDNVSPQIKILGDAVLQLITYTAGTHTFNGILNLPTQAAPSAPNDGDVWREDNTDTGLKIRINGFTKTITVS